MRSVLCSAATILLLGSSILSAQSTSTQPLNNGKLTVWISSSRRFDWDSLFSELRHDFPNLQLNWKRFAPSEFLPAIQSAQASSTLPDAVFIDNAAQGNPFTHLVQTRALAGISRHKEGEWWFILKDAPDLPQAQAFSLWLEVPATSQLPTPHTQLLSPEQKASVSQAAIQVMQARMQSAQPSASQVDPSLTSFSWDWLNSHYLRSLGAQQTPPSILQIGGNDHLAFVTVASPIDTTEGLGIVHSFMLFHNDGSAWKLIFFDNNDSFDGVTGMFNRFDTLGLTNSGTQTPTNISLRAPADEESTLRFPRPWLVFSVNPRTNSLLGIESQFGAPDNGAWSPSAIHWVPVTPDRTNTVRMLAPFGVGRQPHRWRVWAVEKTGAITLSEWRTINFTN